MNNKNNHYDNEFIGEEFGHKPTDKILTDRVDSVMKDKFSVLLQIYQKNAFENGYNPALAFRVIALYLFTQVQTQFNIIEEGNRFVNAQIEKGTLSDLQKCMDMLMIKSLKFRVPQKHIKLWKIKLLVGLKKHYRNTGLKKEKKKASSALRQMCKEQLKKQDVKHDAENYAQVLDILVEEEATILNNKKAKGKIFQAIENGNNIIRILQKAQQLLIPKYQQKLMTAYWEIARLHYHLHYLTYARKYCEITLNISKRINDKKVYASALAMMDALNNG